MSRDKSSRSPSNEEKRENLILAVEELVTGGGCLSGLLVSVALMKIAGDTYLPWLGPLWIGWTGCLLLVAAALPAMVFSCAGLVVGWWLWIRMFAKRMAVTKEEAYLLAAKPFSIPVVTSLCLRIAGVSKAEEKEFRNTRRKRD